MEALADTYERVEIEALPDDPHQYPHPESDEWNDPEWRAYWLDGLTDDELNTMSPREKGARVRAYAWNSGYETYGCRALHYTLACDLFARANVSPLDAPKMFAIGAELAKENQRGQQAL